MIYGGYNLVGWVDWVCDDDWVIGFVCSFVCDVGGGVVDLGYVGFGMG